MATPTPPDVHIPQTILDLATPPGQPQAVIARMDPFGAMVQHDDGRYVSVLDYCRLQEKVQRVSAQNDAFRDQMVEIRQACDFARKDMARYPDEAHAIAYATLNRIREKTFPSA